MVRSHLDKGIFMDKGRKETQDKFERCPGDKFN